MTTGSIRTRLDIGRIIMVPAGAIILLFEVMALTRHSSEGLLRWSAALLTAAFYTLFIWCYLLRGPAHATTRSVTARAAAVVPPWTPFAIPLLRGAPPGAVQQAVSDVLLLAGTAWAAWSLRFPGRN